MCRTSLRAVTICRFGRLAACLALTSSVSPNHMRWHGNLLLRQCWPSPHRASTRRSPGRCIQQGFWSKPQPTWVRERGAPIIFPAPPLRTVKIISCLTQQTRRSFSGCAFHEKFSIYVAEHGAVEQFTRSLAREPGLHSTTANTISPSPTKTELFLTGRTREQIVFLQSNPHLAVSVNHWTLPRRLHFKLVTPPVRSAV